MNKVIFIGYLGRDAELKRTNAGRMLVQFTLATSSRWKDQKGEKHERTDWHRCTAWGERFQNLVPYLAKGTKVCVEGEVRYRDGETKDGAKAHYTDIHIEHIELLGTKRDDASRQARPLGNGKKEAQAAKPQQMELDDDIPF